MSSLENHSKFLQVLHSTLFSLVVYDLMPIFLQASGFGFQQQLVPGIRIGNAPIPNFYLPLVQPQQGQQSNVRRSGAAPIQQQQQQQQMPLIPQQAKHTLSIFFNCCTSILVLNYLPYMFNSSLYMSISIMLFFILYFK